MLIYIRKEKATLVKQGMPDWLEWAPVLSTAKTHAYEKPVGVWNNLISRSALPGQTVYDPCMGSGSSVEACVRNKLFVTGVDIDQAAYLSAQARMANLMVEMSSNNGGK
jgi:DNA modification methylase